MVSNREVSEYFLIEPTKLKTLSENFMLWYERIGLVHNGVLNGVLSWETIRLH